MKWPWYNTVRAPYSVVYQYTGRKALWLAGLYAIGRTVGGCPPALSLKRCGNGAVVSQPYPSLVTQHSNLSADTASLPPLSSAFASCALAIIIPLYTHARADPNWGSSVCRTTYMHAPHHRAYSQHLFVATYSLRAGLRGFLPASSCAGSGWLIAW